MGRPILPTDPADPSGQDRRERGAINEMTMRIRQCGKAYKDSLDQIEFLAVNAKQYEFKTSPTAVQTLLSEVGKIVDSIMGKGGRWLFSRFMKPAYQQGTAKANANIGNQSELYKEARPLEKLLTSKPYLKRLSLLRGREFNDMQGIIGDVKTTLARTLTQGLADGVGPLEIGRRIAESTDIVEHRANRIARTETGEALREGRLAETEAAQSLGIKVGVMHLSALSPTSRKDHVDRHGWVGTVQQEREWYAAEPGRPINCKCSPSEMLLNDDGTPMFEDVVERTRKAREHWQELHPPKKSKS